MPRVSSVLSPCWLVCLVLPLARLSGAQELPVPLPQTASQNTPPAAIIPAEHPVKLPEGAARAGWELLLQNKFAEADAAFRKALQADGKNLEALEGLRSSLVARGDYKGAQDVNLEMLQASGDVGLSSVFAARIFDAMGFVECHEAVLEAFRKGAGKADPAMAAFMRDHAATLLFRADRPVEARQMLAGLGYLDRWQFVAGPFGAKDRNNRIERRFAPERALKTLRFTDGEQQAVPVRKDMTASERGLNLSQFSHGKPGIYYAFTNLESDAEQDALLWASVPGAYRVYLRGLPVLQEPGEEEFRRSGGEVVRVRLAKGSNPLLLKADAAGGTVTLRVLGTDYAPLANVRVQPLAEAELAKQEIVPARGMLFSGKACGSIATRFLRRLAPAEQQAGKGVAALVDSADLTFPEAYWLDYALHWEGQPRARVNLARRLAGSAQDSAAVLDMAAFVLRGAGAEMHDSAAREAEEARRLREHALTVVPDSHQNLLGLYYFFSERKLPDLAFEKIKACAAAHPDSPLAQCELGKAYLNKEFPVEAERCFEQAAKLDNAFLGTLEWFHNSQGNRVRARELRLKEVTLGLLNRDDCFDLAMREGDLKTAEVLLKALETDYPDRAEDLAEKRTHLLEAKGDFKEALRLERKLYDAKDPDDPGRRELLLALVENATRLNDDKTARELLQAYLKQTPGDFVLRQRLREIDGKTLPRWWEKYDVKVDGIDTSAFTNEKYPNANHAWIVDFMVTRVLPDLSRESYVHVAQKVLNLKGIGELSELLVQAQRNDIVFIRTLNPDGSTFLPENVHNFNLAQSASLYKVGPGSILEHAYLEHLDADKDHPALNMAFNFNAIDAPRAVSRWVVLLSDEAKAKLDIRKIRPEMIDEKILPGPPGYTVYQWTNKQVEGIKYEPLMPAANDQEIIPLVQIETREEPFRANGWLLQHEREFLPAEAVAQARKLADGVKGGEAARFDAIVQWVRRAIQPGNDSHTLDDVWFLRAGTSDQMALLTREMAQSVGLNVHSAFANIAYSPGRVWHTKNAPHYWEPGQLANFGSGGRLLDFEPSSGPDRWIQFQGHMAEYFNPYELNAALPGTLAAVTDKDGLRLKRVDGEKLGLAAFTHKIKVQLDAQGGGAVEGTVQLFGSLAGSVRESLADPRRRSQITEYMVRGTWPKIQTPRTKIENEDEFDSPLEISYSGKVGSLAACAEGTYAFAPFLTSCRLLDLRGPAERQNDMLIKSEYSELDQKVVYVAPEGHAWVEVPDDLFLVTEFGFYQVSYQVRGRTLTCTRSYLVPAQRITPERHGALLDFLKPIAADAQARVGYAPVKAESFGPARQEILSTGYATCGEEQK